MEKRHIQSFLMVSAAFFALNASARPNDTRVVTSANATHAVTRVTSTARINERSDSIEK